MSAVASVAEVRAMIRRAHMHAAVRDAQASLAACRDRLPFEAMQALASLTLAVEHMDALELEPGA